MCSVLWWWMDQTGKLQCQAATMKTMPYKTSAQMQIFDRQEAILRLLSHQEQDCSPLTELLAPVFIAAFKDCTGVPERQARLITRQAPHVWTDIFAVTT